MDKNVDSNTVPASPDELPDCLKKPYIHVRCIQLSKRGTDLINDLLLIKGKQLTSIHSPIQRYRNQSVCLLVSDANIQLPLPQCFSGTTRQRPRQRLRRRCQRQRPRRRPRTRRPRLRRRQRPPQARQIHRTLRRPPRRRLQSGSIGYI